MTLQMPDGVADVLRELAAKLGVAAEYVWAALIRQQANVGLACLCGGITLLLLSAFLFWCGAWAAREECADPWGWYTFGVLVVIIGSPLGVSGLLKMLNPGYYALRELLGLIH